MEILWSLRRYREGDELGIFDFLNASFGKWHSLEYWRWKYKRNPAGAPIIWVAERDGKIISHYAVVPVKMKVGNSYVTGSFSCDAATLPDYQGKGVFSSVINRCYLDAAQKNIPLTYGFSDIGMGPTYKRYERIGRIAFFIRMWKPLNWELLMRRYVRNKALAQTAGQLLRKTLCRRTARVDVEIENVRRFDERINEFCREISRNFPIIVRRDDTYLNWRYVEHPEKDYTIYLAIKNDRILGYCVLSEFQSQSLRIGFIVDIIGFQDRYNAVACLIGRALQTFEEHRIDVAGCTMPEDHPYKAIFKRNGFVQHPRCTQALYAAVNIPGQVIDAKEVYCQALKLSQSPFLSEKKNWFILPGDGDQQ